MADFEQLKASVASIIKTNGAEAITGAVLQNVLLTMINSISDGYMFGGVAQHSGSVGNPDYNVFYLGGSGSYTGYGGSIDVPAGSYCVFAYDGAWHQSVIDLGISLGGTVSEGETQGVTGDAVNSALNTLWENITNILDSIEFSDDTSELYKGDRIMQGMRVTAGGVERLLSSFTILAATAAKAGLMSAADKRKLDNFVFTVQDMIETMTVSDVTGAGDTGTRIDESIEWTVDEVTHQIATFTLLAATAVKAGLMSNTDKQAVDALFTIEAEDTTAVDDLGVKLTETLNWTVNNVSQIFAEFTLLAATQSKAGLMSAADKAKLDAYENNIRSMEIVDTTGNADKGDQITETLRWVFGGVSTVITTFTLLAATHTKAGLMSAVDKQLVDALLTIIAQDTTAQADKKTSMIQSLKWTLGGTQQTMASFSILAATAEKAGLMSADDKAKLDALWSSGYQFAGIATPSTTPVSTTSKIFYIATEAGTYFNAVTVTQGINILSWDGSAWSSVQVVDIPILTDDNIPMSDLSIADENSNTLAIFSGGDFKTKNFDTRKTPKQEEGDVDIDLSIEDSQGNKVLVLSYGDIKTKNFDSKNAAMFGKDYADADFAIADSDGNIIALFSNGGFRTKKFDSKNFDAGFIDPLWKFKGKKIAIVGDSISTFRGWLPSDITGYDGSTYATYYPRGDVMSPSETWWYNMMEKLSLIPTDDNINVCAWSGSRVTGQSDSPTNAYAGCSDKRISDIAIRGWNPDIIIIWLSCNDWGNDIPIGTWKISDAIPSEGTITEMRAAYALMLYKIHIAYPNARVFCCTNLDDRLRDRVGGWPSDNRNGVTTTQWNDNIREIADAFGCDVIDIHACGLNYSNLLSFVVDTGLHPNAAGMEMIANKVVAELISKY